MASLSILKITYEEKSKAEMCGLKHLGNYCFSQVSVTKHEKTVRGLKKLINVFQLITIHFQISWSTLARW
jgi:viroplasmin and RNaseH domain-containing protein